MVQGGLKKVQGGLEPPLAPYFPRLCWMIRIHGNDALQDFISTVNNLHPTIKFTHNFSEKEVNFLGTTIHLTNNRLEAEICTKPTDTHQYLFPSSCHPRHVIKNIPKSLALRIRRVCFTDAYFEKHAVSGATRIFVRGG